MLPPQFTPRVRVLGPPLSLAMLFAVGTAKSGASISTGMCMTSEKQTAATTSIERSVALWRRVETSVTAVGFEPTPLRTGALSQRLRPLGQTVVRVVQDIAQGFASHDTDTCLDADARTALLAFCSHQSRQKQTCISRESNPGHIDGNDVFYH